ncbi:hypothetical protein [Legionella tunisiensis]|uniref:hypothetical protein n=1 Tax=Legionella tunisiensis TaxID=1034944 RepID=UPI0002D6CCF9|nr:hypothetical protein [Legionella tunisiensis]
MRILKEVFKCNDGNYAHENYYWNCYDLQQLINQCNVSDKQRFQLQVDELKVIYDEMSDSYQQSKSNNDIPLG